MTHDDASPQAPMVAFRLSALGDVTLTTGALDYFHRTRGLRFIYITKPGMEAALTGHPAIDEIVTVDQARLKGRDWWAQASELAERFRGMTLLDLHGTLRSRMLSLRWKGPVRRYPKFGLARRLYRHTGWGFLRRTLETVNVPQRYALALDKTPPPATELTPTIRLTNDEFVRARARLDALGLSASTSAASPTPRIALHPYATHPDKAWPREHWLTLTGLLDARGLDWFVVGRDAKPLIPGAPRDLTNATGIRETMALLGEADALITNDSGPMHWACGVSTPVVALFGPTSRAWGFYPAAKQDMVLERAMDCRPCTLHGKNRCERGRPCLADIAPEDVLAAIPIGQDRSRT